MEQKCLRVCWQKQNKKCHMWHVTRMRTRRYRLWRLCQKEAKNMVVNKICVHSHYEFAQISDHVAEGQLVDWFQKQFPFVKQWYFHYSDILICPLIDWLTEILSTNKLLASFGQNYQLNYSISTYFSLSLSKFERETIWMYPFLGKK